MVRTVDIVIVLQPFGSGKNTCFVLIQSTLRSRYFFCVMALMAQGAHRGRPVAAALCTPGLWPPKSPLRGSFDLSRQASGRAEAASVQNTALSPHPCGLPRPAGNVSAILRPPTPAVSASVVNKITAGRTGRKPPPGNTDYSRSAPLLAMTFLYHQNDFLRLRASVPLPASSRSTYTKP